MSSLGNDYWPDELKDPPERDRSIKAKIGIGFARLVTHLLQKRNTAHMEDIRDIVLRAWYSGDIAKGLEDLYLAGCTVDKETELLLLEIAVLGETSSIKRHQRRLDEIVLERNMVYDAI